MCGLYLLYRTRRLIKKFPSDPTDGIKNDDGAIFGVKSVDVRSSSFGQSSPYFVSSSDQSTTGETMEVYGLSASVRQSLQAFQARMSRSTKQHVIPIHSEFRDAPSMSAVTSRDLNSVPTTINPVVCSQK